MALPHQAEVKQSRQSYEQPTERRHLPRVAYRVHRVGKREGRERQEQKAQERPEPMFEGATQIVAAQEPHEKHGKSGKRKSEASEQTRHRRSLAQTAPCGGVRNPGKTCRRDAGKRESFACWQRGRKRIGVCMSNSYRVEPRASVFRRGFRVLGAPGLLLLLAGCGGEPEAIPSGTDLNAAAVDPAPADLAPRACVPPAGVSGSPGTLGAALTLINSLPHPVSVGCFLESLDRPLQANATKSVFSAQPAVGARSPRIFLLSGQLVASIVPDGAGRDLVEFSQLTSSTRSIKAEIAFPVVAPLEMSDAFSRLPFNNVSVCAFCHAEETRVTVDGTPGGYESEALRPRAEEAVSLSSVKQEYLTCDAAREPERCAILTAIFAHGAVQPGEFPADMKTFF